MIPVKQRKIAGSFSNFEQRYKPLYDDDGLIMRNWDDPTLEGVEVHYIWTIVDCDGVLIITPGLATVNYFARVLCCNPWRADEEFNTGYRY